jgi:hypothetical protein
MKLGLQNYTLNISTKNSCMKFSKNKIKSLKRYDAQNYRILHNVVQRLSKHNIKM